ncbi:transposase [Vibrio cholerae]|nr:transposase [Vibrio cholerae]GIB62767.1 transposase [Vibrio cholerae]
MTNKEKRIIHSPEFKTENSEASRESGSHCGSKTALLTSLEIAKLKWQLAEQAEELDIVKKTTTYFAKN